MLIFSSCSKFHVQHKISVFFMFERLTTIGMGMPTSQLHKKSSSKGQICPSPGQRNSMFASFASASFISLHALILLVSNAIAFYAGQSRSFQQGIITAECLPCPFCNSTSQTHNLAGASNARKELIIENRIEAEFLRKEEKEGIDDTIGSKSSILRTSTGVADFAHGMARMNHDDFVQTFGYGSQNVHSKGSREALLLYSKNSLPSDHKTSVAVLQNDGKLAPMLDSVTATENCHFLNVVTINAQNTATCTAIVGGYEAFHVQRWEKSEDLSITVRHTREGMHKIVEMC